MADRLVALRAALARVQDPELRKPLMELDMFRRVEVVDDVAEIDLALTVAGCPAAGQIEREVRAAAESVVGPGATRVNVSVMTPAERAALTEKLRGARAERAIPFDADSLTRVYAVASGKGGVGKSTVTANLAVSLAARGLAVGIIDADVHGFSIPGLLGMLDENDRAPVPVRIDDMVIPPVAHGVKVISMGMFLRAENQQAVAWRGPLLHRAIRQFLTDVYFGDLDILLLDLPPGTGDIAISIGQLLPGAELIVVTTPQKAAVEVAERSATLARQTGGKVFGVVENMAGLPQPDGSVLELFGSGGGRQLTERFSEPGAPVPLLANIPLSMALREGGDSGLPIAVNHPEDPASRELHKLASLLAKRPRSLAGRGLRTSIASH